MYIFGSGILLNLVFISIIFFGLYKIFQLGVSFEDIVNKSADKIEPRAPALANLIRKVTEETNDDWVFSNLNVESWSGKGAKFSFEIRKNSKSEVSSFLNVSNSRDFLNALNKAEKGQVIKLNPGIYKIEKRALNVKNSGTLDNPIKVMGNQSGDVLLELDTLEGFYVDKQFWVFENLRIKGVCSSHSECEHAFHIVGEGRNVVIKNNVVTDFNAAIKVNGIKSGNVNYYPDNGLIENNTFFNHTIRDTGNPVALLDIVGVNDWIVRDNLIADFIKARSDKVSYAAFFKGNGSRNTFERNLIICRLNLRPQGGSQVGLSLGGGGTSDAACRGNVCAVEDNSGVIRHNLIMNCDDVAIYLNKSKDAEIYNNTLINTLGIDVRFEESSATIANNFLTGRIKNRNGGSGQQLNNVVSDFDDVKDYYTDPMAGNFVLKNGEAILDQGINLQKMEQDFCGAQRGPSNVDIGAFEYSKTVITCNPFSLN